jgi:hypothetical protein
MDIGKCGSLFLISFITRERNVRETRHGVLDTDAIKGEHGASFYPPSSFRVFRPACSNIRDTIVAMHCPALGSNLHQFLTTPVNPPVSMVRQNTDGRAVMEVHIPTRPNQKRPWRAQHCILCAGSPPARAEVKLGCSESPSANTLH